MEQIDPRNLLVKIAKILKRLDIPYLITGGIAVLIWGRPRFTADIDIVVELRENDIKKLRKALIALSKSGYIDEEMMQRAIVHQEEFNFIDNITGVKVDFWILKKDDPFDVSRLKRRVTKDILGRKVYFTTAEDLILIKALWCKESLSSRHLEDIESILKISVRKLNMRYLKQWAKKLGVWSILSKLMCGSGKKDKKCHEGSNTRSQNYT